MSNENRKFGEALLRCGLHDGVIKTWQVAEADRLGPGTFLGANGFVGRVCKHCCGPDKPRGNIALPMNEMYDNDTCKLCHELYGAWLGEQDL